MIEPRTSVTIDLGDVETGLHAMERRARQLGPAFKDLKKPMRADQLEHAKAKAGPEGAWAPRAASTKHAHKKLPRKLLGRLPSAVSYRALPTSVVGVSRVPWSQAHMDGDHVGHNAKLPRRVFLFVSDKLADLAASVIARALEAAWGGR